ncbi:MAG: glycosyltransferase family 2 protein [Candidatus Paceibacterota bacterium]
MKKISVSCIIPAYNEGERIARVLDAVVGNPDVSEIIVVDDGSRDRTLEIVRRYEGVTLVVHEKNKGKSAAICTGIERATGEYLLFLDADLIGLTSDDVSRLVESVVSGRANISISYRGNSPRLWKIVGFDYISGERVMRRDFVAGHTDEILALPRFGLEVFMNSLVVARRMSIAIVAWPNVESPFKSKKQGVIKGALGDAKMMVDIFRTINVFGLARQIMRMRSLRVK